MKLKKKIIDKLYQFRRNRYLCVDTNHYPVVQYGNEYGGFFIYDKDIKKEAHPIVYSFGIGEDLSFSESLERISPLLSIYAYDPTPKAIKFVQSHELYRNEHFHFFTYGLSDKDESTLFFLPKNEKYVSGSAEFHDELESVGVDVEMRSLNTILKYNGHNHINLLKMDIEGSEFKVVESLNKIDAKIDQICMEVHDRFFNDGIKKLQALVSTMRNMGYLLVYISASKEELTFLRDESITY